MWDAVRGLINDGIDKINDALEFKISIPGPDISINPPNIPHLASGGIVTRPTLAVIGERGPEAVIPLNGASRGVGRQTPMVYIETVENYEAVSLQTLTQRLDHWVRTAERMR